LARSSWACILRSRARSCRTSSIEEKSGAGKLGEGRLGLPNALGGL
jgi:hypothetical protein